MKKIFKKTVLLLVTIIIMGVIGLRPTISSSNYVQAYSNGYSKEQLTVDKSLNDFKDYFNSLSANFALQVFIEDFEIEGSNFKAVLTDEFYQGTSIVGTIDDSSNIAKVVLFCDSAEEDNELLRYNLLMQNIISFLSSSMNQFEREEFVHSLGIPADNSSLVNVSSTVKQDGHTFSLQIEGSKIVFSITL